MLVRPLEMLFLLVYTTLQTSVNLNKMPCYRKDDRAMRPIYELFHPNFVHAYGHYSLLCADLILNEFKLRKFCLFLQEWRFGRSRSSEVIDFGADRKRVCDFLLVRNSNLGLILHHFGDMTAFMCSWPHLYSTVILACSRCTRSPMLGSDSA